MSSGPGALRLVELGSDRVGKRWIQGNHSKDHSLRHCHTETISGTLTIPIFTTIREGDKKWNGWATGKQANVTQPVGTSCKIQCHLKANPKDDHKQALFQFPNSIAGKELWVLRELLFFFKGLFQDKCIKVLLNRPCNIGFISSVWTGINTNWNCTLPTPPSLCHCSVLQVNYFKI
mgnify:CR=1 FL=1